MPATSRFMRSALVLTLTSVSVTALYVSPAVAKDPDQTLEDLLGVQPETGDSAKGRTLTIVSPEPVAPALEMPTTAAATQASVISDPSLVLKLESPDPSVAPVAKAPAAPTRTPVAASSEPAAAVTAAAKSPADRMPSTLLAELDGLPATAPQDVPASSPIGMPNPLPQLVSETLGDGRTAASAKAARPAQPAAPALPSATAAALGLDIDGAPANVFPEDHNRGSESVSAADLLTRSSAPASAEAAEPVTPAKPEKPRQPDVAAVKPPKPAKPAPEKPVAEAPKPEPESEAAKPAAADTANATQTPEQPPAEDTSMPPIAQPSTARASEPGRTEGSATPRQLTAPANDTLSAPKTLTSGELVGRITFPAFNSTPPLVIKDMIRDKILPTLRMNPNLRVQVSGFADWTPNGSVDASTAISQRRAENITRFLIEEGIEPSRLQTRGVGVDFLPGAARDRVDITAIEP